METIIISDDNFDNTSRGYLAFPFNEEQFKSFVTGLLGKPQTISRPIYGQFEIYLNDIQNIHALLNQRVTQQNAAKLVQFKSSLYFSDASSILLGSYDELITYNEIRPITTVAIQLSWVYLIKFSDKDIPEKQEIVISIKTGQSQYKPKDEEIMIGIKKEETFLNSSITYDVAYTARTWGFDIDKLLNDHLNSILIKPHPFNSWVNRYSNGIGNFTALLALIGGVAGIMALDVNSIIKNAELITEITKTDNLNEKMNFIITKITKNDNNLSSSFFYYFGVFIFSILIGIRTATLCSMKPGSYIILTREDVKSLPEKRKKEGISYLKLFLVFLSAIAIELIGAFTYAYLTK